MGTVGYPGVTPSKLPQPYGGEAGKPLVSADVLKAAINGWKGIQFATESNASMGEGRDGRQHDDTQIYGEDILLGYRWFDYMKQNGTYATKASRILFPFGYGLSYTTFAYGKPSISGNTVSVNVKNTGKVAGKEIVQFYVGDDKASVIRPVKELKHFAKVTLEPGQEKTVTYTIQDDDLKFFDEQAHQWTSEPGTFTIYVAANSADIQGKVKYSK